MRLAEIDGKALLRRHGIAVPRGVLLEAGDATPAEAGDWPGHVLKAQVLEGGRGKRGLVRRLADASALSAARRHITDALGDPEAPLLLEEAVAIAFGGPQASEPTTQRTIASNPKNVIKQFAEWADALARLENDPEFGVERVEYTADAAIVLALMAANYGVRAVARHEAIALQLLTNRTP
jgi:hypothetical protein